MDTILLLAQVVFGLAAFVLSCWGFALIFRARVASQVQGQLSGEARMERKAGFVNLAAAAVCAAVVVAAWYAPALDLPA